MYLCVCDEKSELLTRAMKPIILSDLVTYIKPPYECSINITSNAMMSSFSVSMLLLPVQNILNEIIYVTA